MEVLVRVFFFPWSGMLFFYLDSYCFHIMFVVTIHFYSFLLIKLIACLIMVFFLIFLVSPNLLLGLWSWFHILVASFFNLFLLISSNFISLCFIGHGFYCNLFFHVIVFISCLLFSYFFFIFILDYGLHIMPIRIFNLS